MSNQRIAIITDSTSDLSPEMREKYGITVVPQHIIWGTEELLDGVDIQPETFYKRLTTDPVHPKSSQPTPQTFLRYVNEAKAAGAEEVVILTVSNQLSGTILSAQGAAEQADIPVHVIDSMSASMGLGYQAIAAAEVRAQGGNAEAMRAAADKVRSTMQIYLTVDTLEYLHRGGRIGGAAKLVGTALQLKPMLMLDHSAGRIEAVERTRTRAKAVDAMYNTFFSKLDTSRPMHLCVIHADSMGDAQALAQRVKSDYNPASLQITNVTPVIGVHVGPGTLALVGYTA